MPLNPPHQHWRKLAIIVVLLLPLLSPGSALAMETNVARLMAAPGSHTKQTYSFKVVGDCKIQADVYRLNGSEPRPAIVWIHGGALITGHRGNLQQVQLNKYLDVGFNVISIDYRLAPETKLKFIIEDVRDAFRWVRKRGPKLAGIDPDRIAVVGHSAGGYLALMSGICVKPRPKAIVSFYGYGDIVGEWYSQPDPFYSQQPAVTKDEAYAVVGNGVISETNSRERFRFYLYCRQNGLWPKEVSGHDPAKRPEIFDALCPVRNVTKKYPPTLLVHGDQDTDVPCEQSVLMAEQLKRHAVEHQLITMTNRGHGFDGGRRAVEDPVVSETFDQIVAFLKKYTGR